MNVYEIRNPATFTTEPIQQLFVRAFKGDRPTSASIALREFVVMCELPHVSVMVGEEEGELHGLIIGFGNTSGLYPWPRTYHIFNEGSFKLRDLLIKKMAARYREWGYNRHIAVNMSGRSDATWLRSLRRAGMAERLGSAFLFTLEEDDE